jgi:hypothetical protein
MEQLLLWLPADSPMPRELGPADAGVYGATAFSPNGDHIISTGHTLRMLDVKTGMELWRNSRNSYPFLSVSFRHDGNVIVTGPLPCKSTLSSVSLPEVRPLAPTDAGSPRGALQIPFCSGMPQRKQRQECFLPTRSRGSPKKISPANEINFRLKTLSSRV